MKTRRVLLVTFLIAGLPGCAALIMPQNADEYRARMPEKYTEKLEVKRPFHTVSQVLKRKSAECLDVSVTRTYTEYNGPYHYQRTTTVKYRPAVRVSAKKTVLQLQSDDGKRGGMQKIPQGGMYILVVDAYPGGHDATRL